MQLHLIPNSHIDPVWLWDKYEGLDEVINTFRSACDLLDENTQLTFTASSIQFYEWILKFDPGLFDRIAKKVAEGRWEIAGGWWVEADTNLSCETSLIKQAEISQNFVWLHFNQAIEVAYLPDTFGHPAGLPKILANTGFRYLIFCRPDEIEKSDLPANLFYWEYAGERILAYRLKHYYTQSKLSVDKRKALLLDPEYLAKPVNCFFFGIGDHGGGPSKAEIRFFDQFLEEQTPGAAGYSSCLRFFQEASQLSDIPTYRGDLHAHAVGCYSVQRQLKQAMRHSERALMYATRALAMNHEGEDSLEPAWKTILFNQFHDILPGSCSEEATQMAIAELGGAQHLCRETTYRVLKGISRMVPSNFPGGEYRIFNTLPYEITVPLGIEIFQPDFFHASLRDADGHEIAIQETLASSRAFSRRWEFVDTLPARGFKSYAFFPATQNSDPVSLHFAPIEGKPENCTESETIDWQNRLKSIFPSGLEFQVIDDPSDTWGHGVSRYNRCEGNFHLDTSAYLDGPVADRLFQRWSYQKSRLEVTIAKYLRLPGIYMNITVNWVERQKILKLSIPRTVASYNIKMQVAGGMVERLADGKELPLHHWIWLPLKTGGLGILQDGAFACDCTANHLSITLIRSSVYAWHDPIQLDPNDPQRYTDLGEQRIHLCLLTLEKLDETTLNRLTGAFLEPCTLIRESGIRK
jgi:alpha-mannosidase